MKNIQIFNLSHQTKNYVQRYRNFLLQFIPVSFEGAGSPHGDVYVIVTCKKSNVNVEGGIPIYISQTKIEPERSNYMQTPFLEECFARTEYYFHSQSSLKCDMYYFLNEINEISSMKLYCSCKQLRVRFSPWVTKSLTICQRTCKLKRFGNFLSNGFNKLKFALSVDIQLIDY